MPPIVPLTLEFLGRAPRAAVLVLDGASVSDARAALATASAFDRHPIRIAVDGGIRTLRRMGHRTDLIVGDLDSAGAIPRGVPATTYPSAKDFSDFSGALGEARRLGANVATVAGLLGGRLDHEWANVLECAASARRFAAVIAPGRRGLVVVTTRAVRARLRRGALVSVFAPRGNARVSLAGTRWPLRRRLLAPGSLGLSNVARGTVTLEVHAGVAALVVPAQPARSSTN